MLLRRLIIMPLLPLTLAACDGAALNFPGFGNRAPDAAVPVQEGPPAISPLEQPIEVGAGRPVGTANAETVNVAAFVTRAADWSAVVDGKAVALARDGARTIRIPVRRIDFGSGVEFAGSIGNQAFSMTVRAADCADGSTLSAAARVGGKSLAPGCAGPATAEQVAQIAKAAPAPAPKAAPKPKAAPAPKAAVAATPAPTTPMPAPPTATPTAPTSTPQTPAAGTPAPTGPTTPSAETAAPVAPAPTVVVPGGPTGLSSAPVVVPDAAASAAPVPADASNEPASAPANP